MSEKIELNLNGYTFRVKFYPPSDMGGEDVYGKVFYNELLIAVNEETPKAMRPIVILHEAIHAILEQCGFDDQEERYARALAWQLVPFLRNNPMFVKALMGDADIGIIATAPPAGINEEAFLRD